jgi:hypothetical protein
MGKFFTVVEGKAHDWKFTKSKACNDETPAWNFHLGEPTLGLWLKHFSKGETKVKKKFSDIGRRLTAPPGPVPRLVSAGQKQYSCFVTIPRPSKNNHGI